MANQHNATFHAFKTSGKWYSTARGHLSPGVHPLGEPWRQRRQIIEDNGGRYPGLGTGGDGHVYVVVPDEGCDCGAPLLLRP